MDREGEGCRESPLRRANKLDAHVGRRLRQRRLQLGMSQDDVAIALGISRIQLLKYEMGDNRVSSGRLYELARVLAVPVTWFYEDGETEPSPEGPMLSDEEIVKELKQSVRAISNYSLKWQLVKFARLLEENALQAAPAYPSSPTLPLRSSH